MTGWNDGVGRFRFNPTRVRLGVTRQGVAVAGGRKTGRERKRDGGTKSAGEKGEPSRYMKDGGKAEIKQASGRGAEKRERRRTVCCEDEGTAFPGGGRAYRRMGATFRFDLLGYIGAARGVT